MLFWKGLKKMYDVLSGIYDEFNKGFDYGLYLEKIFESWNLPDKGLALDCGCGTGEIIKLLSDRGYECTGIDSNSGMLAVAADKLEKSGYIPHLACQDLACIDLYGAYDIAFCTLDTVNHITDKKCLKKFFSRLYNFIEPHGFFVFDIKTKSGFMKNSGCNIYDSNGDIMMMKSDFKNNYAVYEFLLFEKTSDGKYEMYTDFVEERYYEPVEIKALVNAAGLDFIGRERFGNRLIYCFQKNNC